jgi:lipopolysaccharide export system permease protein
MKLLDRYLLREMVVPFLIGQGAIVLMLTGSILYNNANVLLMNQVPVVYVAKMVLYFLPFLVHMTMPVAMAVAASLMVSRLGRDSEITVMRSSGMSLRRVFRIVFLMGFLVSVGDFLFGEYVVPHAVRRLDATVQEMVINIPNLRPQSGQFIVSSDQSYAIYVETMTQRKGYLELRNIVISASPRQTARSKTDPVHMTAETGRFENGMWILNKPLLVQHSIKGDRLIYSHPETFSLTTVVDPQAFQSGFLLQIPMWQMARSSTRTFVQMGHDLARNRALNIRDDFTLLDYHFKLSVPFSCLVMAVCCAPLALRFARGGGFMGTLLSICLVFVYWNTLLLSRILGSPGPSGGAPLLPPTTAAWSQNVIFVLIGLWTLKRSE